MRASCDEGSLTGGPDVVSVLRAFSGVGSLLLVVSEIVAVSVSDEAPN